MTGTITGLEHGRGVGTVLGEDGKYYLFRRSDLRDNWFHELTEGAIVDFEPGTHLRATRVRLVSRSA